MQYKHLSDEKLEEYTKGMAQPHIAIALVPALALELQRARKELAVYKNGALYKEGVTNEFRCSFSVKR